MEMDRSNGIVQRRHMVHDGDNQAPNQHQSFDEILKCDQETNGNDENHTKLTLMEELLLLGMKERDGYTSLWSDSLSIGIRGCILIELGLCGRIELNPASLRRNDLSARKIILKDDTPTGDVILDETIRHIKAMEAPESVQNWIGYLSGDTWNPLKLKYQLRSVRERLAKNLVEKGVLTTQKTSFILFDMTTHPVIDAKVKPNIIKKVQDALLSKWVNDVHRIGKRMVVLILIAQHSEVLEPMFQSMNDFEYDLVTKRVQYLLDTNFEEEAKKPNTCEVLWAVLAALMN